MTGIHKVITVVMALVLVSAPSAATAAPYTTRPVKLTDGPYEVVRGPSSVKMSDDLVLYSRAGSHQVKDNISGLTVERWDNGTYVLDISDHREYMIAHEVIDADISGNLAVWLEGRDIVVLNYFNGSRTVLPVPDARPVYRPDIDGDRIVWTDCRNDPAPFDQDQLSDIYIYNLTLVSEARLTFASNLSTKGPPHMDGDTVAWSDDRYGTFDVMMMYLGNLTEVRVTNSTGGEFDPKVSSRAVAWLDDRLAPDPTRVDIFYRDLTTWREGRASTSGQVQAFDLSGDRIIWSDNSSDDKNGHDGDILLHDISKNRTKTYYSSIWGQSSPAMSGNRVVWVDRKETGGEIFTLQRVDRPYLGLDLASLVLILMVVVVAVAAFALHLRSMAREERDIRAYEQKALVLKRGRSLKRK